MSNETTESIDWGDFTAGASIMTICVLVSEFAFNQPYGGILAVMLVLLAHNLWPETRWAKDE